MKFLGKKQVKLIARLGVDFSNTHPGLTVCFNHIHKPEEGERIRFVHESDLKPEVAALRYIEITSQTDANQFMNENVSLYGFDTFQISNKLLTSRDIHALSKCIKSIERKVEKHCHENGYYSSFQQYLKLIFNILGVDAIEFSAYSESIFRDRYKHYELSELDDLIDKGLNLLFIQNGWLKTA